MPHSRLFSLYEIMRRIYELPFFNSRIMVFLAIFLVLFGLGLTVFTTSPAFAVPPRESEFIYDLSDTIVTGKIISTDTNFSSDQNLYQIKVEKFIKNPQDTDVITATGQNTKNLKIENHVFETNERGLFFLQKDKTSSSGQYQDIFRIHYESAPIRPEWDACNIFDSIMPQQHWVIGGRGPIMKMYQADDFRTDSFVTGKKIIITYDIFNHTPDVREIPFGMTISNRDDANSLYLFSEIASYTLEPCVAYHAINWTFTPNKPGHYSAELNNLQGSRYTMTVLVNESSSDNKMPETIPSPLQQTKIGIEPRNIVCKPGLGLVLKPSEYDLSACIKSESVQKLQERGWSVFVSGGISHR